MGYIIYKQALSVDSAFLASDICSLVNQYSKVKRMGRAGCEVKIRLPNSNVVRKPDGIYVPISKWPLDRALPRINAWNIVPDICLEVVSPSDIVEELQAKIGEYFREGVRQVWVAYPVQQQLFVYDSPVSIKILSRSDTLKGGDIIPGLELPLSELFLNNDPAT